MSAARNLLDDLAVIGATVRPAGEQLILRAGTTPIPAALVRRVRDAKSDLLAILANKVDSADRPGSDGNTARSNRVVEWLDAHPAPSQPGRCAWCGRPESRDAVVLPFGTEPGTHSWLHSECWPAWHQSRQREAVRAIAHDQELRR